MHWFANKILEKPFNSSVLASYHDGISFLEKGHSANQMKCQKGAELTVLTPVMGEQHRYFWQHLKEWFLFLYSKFQTCPLTFFRHTLFLHQNLWKIIMHHFYFFAWNTLHGMNMGLLPKMHGPKEKVQMLMAQTHEQNGNGNELNFMSNRGACFFT